MPLRSQIFYQDHYYHIYNRGAGKQNIFQSEDNYRSCLGLIQKYSTKYKIKIIAYCLMPNHYHFLLRQDSDITISSFMRDTFNSYVQSYNAGNKRCGTLFEGRFKHIVVGKDNYVLQLCRYIHLNPVAAGIVKRPEDWEFSDYREWIGQAYRTPFDIEFISRYFMTAKDYRKFVMEYLRDKRKDDAYFKYMLD